MTEQTVTLYGIPNCDTIRKTRRTMTEAGVDYEFHNYRADGVPAETLSDWIQRFGWERILNRSGTTWRKLPDALRESVVDNASALAVVLEHEAIIRRPIMDWGDGTVSVSFAEVAQRLA